MLYLEVCYELCDRLAETDRNHPNILRSKGPSCSGAIIYTLKGARAVLQAALPIWDGLDRAFPELIYRGILEVWIRYVNRTYLHAYSKHKYTLIQTTHTLIQTTSIHAGIHSQSNSLFSGPSGRFWRARVDAKWKTSYSCIVGWWQGTQDCVSVMPHLWWVEECVHMCMHVSYATFMVSRRMCVYVYACE